MQDGKQRERNSFDKDTTMARALALDPELGQVLMRFHIGGCTRCGFDGEDTIAQVAADNGVPVERLLAALNREA